jgi:microcystin-dependent protein
MDQPYVGAIFAHAGTFAPRDWALCQGQSQSIANNEVLFTLIGTNFGGDGVQTFNLPDLRGRIPVGQGTGPGLSPYVIGQASGTESVSILSSNLPQHNHLVNIVNGVGNATTPATNTYVAGSYAGGVATSPLSFYGTGPSTTTLASSTIGLAGNSIPMSIIQPILATNYIIALFGIFPSRN